MSEVNIERKEKVKKLLLKPKIIIPIAIIIAIVAGVGIFNAVKKDDKKSGELQTAQASYGKVSKAIEGSGTIEAIDQYEVTALSIKGEVLECTFEEGDTVEKGQVLYRIDSSDMENSIDNAKSSVEKAQISYDDTLEDYNKNMANESVFAPVSGVLTTLSVKNGDKVNNGANVAVIKNSDKMLLEINFNADEANNIYVGEAATVNLQSSFSNVTGTVTRVGTGAFVTNEGASVKTIEITVNNPGAIKEGDIATATVGSFACNSEGTFKYSAEENVTVKVSGDVYNLAYKQGDYIQEGALLFNIDSDYKESTLKNSKMSLEDAKDNLQKLYEDLEEYTIKAPIAGEIVQKNIKQGEKIDNSNGNEPLAIISDLSMLVFDMSIDELDITSISVGQKVEITADAYEGKKFSGYVDKISIVGTSQQGVTSYPVTVVVDSDNKDLLIPGMNVSASIIIEERENVLVLPVSAVRRGNVVIAKTDSEGVGVPNMKSETSNSEDVPSFRSKTDLNEESAKDDVNGEMPSGKPSEAPNDKNASENKQNKDNNSEDTKTKTDGKAQKNKENKQSGASGEDSPFLRNLEIPDGYKAIFVETGLSDDSFIEIVSGLNEGDTVVLPDITAAISSPFGFMGGAMPSGGMGGAMPSGAPNRAAGVNRQSGGMGGR